MSEPTVPDEVARVSNLNLPNALTTLRILIVPFFGWALLHDGGHDTGWRWFAYLLFAVAMFTDKIDGDIARSRGLITNFGKIADPIADKAITGMAFIGLSLIGHLWWWITIVVLLREWSVTLARLSIARKVVMAANRGGKAKTMAQALSLGLFIIPAENFTGAWVSVGIVFWWMAAVLMGIAVTLTITSGLEFVRDVVRHFRHADA